MLIAGDSTKLRAQNSKKNDSDQKKIDRHPAYIDRKPEEYGEALESADGDAERRAAAMEIEKQSKRRTG